MEERPVAAGVRPGAVRGRLPVEPPEHGEPFAEILRDVDELILPGLTHWNHPRFFAWFANTGSEPGILAELLTAALNVNAMTWLASPAATELELVTMDWLAQLLGLPRGLHGHIEDTASTSTIAALAAARSLRPGGVVYASAEANFSVEKAARLVGLEYRTVEVDDAYRMRTDFALDDATAVVATVGTTGTTSVDPVPELARRCEEAGVWLHVDAAYAGAAAVCPELRWCLEGCDRADSIVVNPHKWLFTPMDCSAFWSRRPDVLQATFATSPDYLASTGDAVDLKDFGPGARPPLPGAEAVVRAADVRHRRAAGDHSRARPPRPAVRVVGRSRAGLGRCRATSVLDRVLPSRRSATTSSWRGPRPRRASCTSPPRACVDRMRFASRSATAAPPKPTCVEPGRCSVRAQRRLDGAAQERRYRLAPEREAVP